MENKNLEVRYMTPSEVRKNEDNEVVFTLSTEAIDRHGTMIPIDEWRLDNYNKNGIVLLQHGRNWTVDSVLGTGRVWTEKGALMLAVKFEPENINPTAEKVRKKIEFGSIRATSVGFIPKDYEWRKIRNSNDDETEVLVLKDCELLEASIVDIPSNPEALKKSIDVSHYPKHEDDQDKIKRSARSANSFHVLLKNLKRKK